MPESPFIPDNFLTRLAKKLVGFGRNETLDGLSDHFGDPLFTAKNYIQPSCQSKPPTGDDDDGAVERRAVFGVINEFLGDCSGDPRAGRNCMFLLGDAGTGKTSLLTMLKLAHLTALWPSHYHCELWKLGMSTMEEISNLKTPRKTVLLLDALNEDPSAPRDVFGRVAGILRATRQFHRVIVTCRTAYFSNVGHDAFSLAGTFASGGFGCPAVYLSLFNNTQMDKYLKRRFRRMEEPVRKRAKSILNEMGSFKARPLLLSHVDDLVHSRCKVWNEVSTYDALIDAWLDREQRRIHAADSRAPFRKESALEACIKLARLMQLNESRGSVSKSDLAGSPLQETEIDHIEKLDCRGRSFLRNDASGSYRFTHASILEFLIALGVKNGQLHSGKKRIPATPLIITFLVHCNHAGTEWRALDLTLASLGQAALHDADFSRAFLVSADLAGCVFSIASFDNADLSSCEAHRAQFSNCSFESTKAANAFLHTAAFSGSRFTNATFVGSVLSQATFDGCKFDHTGLADTNFGDSVFTRCTISDSSFKSSRLSGAEFRDCSLANLKFDGCSLAGAKFTNTTLQNVSLQSVDMRTAKLDDTFLKAVRAGTVKNWKTAAWDPAAAAALKLAPKENDGNAKAIDNDRGR